MPRKGAWEVLQAVAAGAFAEIALDRAIRRYHVQGSDKKLLTELAYGTIRQRKLLDSWIDYLAKVEAVKQPPLLRWLLHLGLYQILKMDKVPPSAAVNTSVELAKQHGLQNLAPVVNALLRKASRLCDAGEGIPMPSTIIEKLAIQHSLPSWFIKELINWRGQKEAEAIAQACNRLPSIDLRVNRSKTNLQAMQLSLREAGIESVPIQGSPDGLEVKIGLGDITHWPGYKEGKWSVQDRSSQWIAPLLEAKPGDCILDACAAPGGKSTHLAEIVGNSGEIWSVDRSPRRLKKVSANALRLNISSLNYLVADASSLIELKPEWKGYFQRILVDAPCSGLGTLARNPDARWRMSPTKIDQLVDIQARLLKGVLPLLSCGGRIVYSTCTLHPEENCRQIERFISLNPCIQLKYQKQIWPDDKFSGDGFYAAVMDHI